MALKINQPPWTNISTIWLKKALVYIEQCWDIVDVWDTVVVLYTYLVWSGTSPEENLLTMEPDFSTWVFFLFFLVPACKNRLAHATHAPPMLPYTLITCYIIHTIWISLQTRTDLPPQPNLLLVHHWNILNACSFSEENIGIWIRDTWSHDPHIWWTNSLDFQFHIISRYNVCKHELQLASRKISSGTDVSSVAKRKVVLTRWYHSDFLCWTFPHFGKPESIES